MNADKNIRSKTWKNILIIFVVLILLLAGYFISAIYISTPRITDRSAMDLPRKELAADFYKIGPNWLKKNDQGLWEMYVEGDGFERGAINGKLTKELGELQETVFISQIQKLIPNESYLNFLKYFVAYFNRNMPKHISQEYQEEIYGVSLSASDKFDGLAPKYYRILNYHSAHDIGHALQDKNMTVGCTSFGVWNNKTADGKLLIGRNFDFFAGEDFATNKIVCFTKPSKGNKFMYVTWAGFTGVVSGMNDKGLTVTINASKSDIPKSAATPISLLAKEILQYADNIESALEISQKRKTFVSESILLGSAKDKRTAIIEKTPTKTSLYSESGEQLICANHFRGDDFKSDYINNKNIIESSSIYRKLRMEQLLGRVQKFTPQQAASVLRNQQGLNDHAIGLGNEKGINQLLAHHSIIFQPEDGLVWVSTHPFQLGEYLCYDLNKIFKEPPGLHEKKKIIEKDRTIPADPFLRSKQYRDFILFKKIKTYLDLCISSPYDLRADEKFLEAFERSNPESYYTYKILGDYYKKRNQNEKALLSYRTALLKEVATGKEAEELMALIKKLNREEHGKK